MDTLQYGTAPDVPAGEKPTLDLGTFALPPKDPTGRTATTGKRMTIAAELVAAARLNASGIHALAARLEGVAERALGVVSPDKAGSHETPAADNLLGALDLSARVTAALQRLAAAVESVEAVA